MSKRVVILVLVAIAISLSSCRKEEQEIVLHQEQVVASDEIYEYGPEEAPIANDVPEPDSLDSKSILGTINVSPTVGSYVPVSSGVLKGTCGSYAGGMIRAKILLLSGSTLKVEVSLVSGAPISNGGTVYLKLGHVCGSVLASQSYVSGQVKVVITANVNLNQGVMDIYPVLHLGATTRYWASPLLLYTLPMYASSSNYGAVLGTVNGVVVYRNPLNYYSGQNSYVGSTYTGKKWQCVEYVNRYYLLVYGKNIQAPGANANQYYSSASSRGLVAYANGTATPRVGDIVCWSGGTEGNGHVAIVIEVQDTWIKVAHQNGGSTDAIGYKINRTGASLICTWNNYSIQGLLRCQ